MLYQAAIGVGDIDDLASIERGDGMAETGGCTGERRSGNPAEFSGRVRASYGPLSVYSYNRADKRRHEEAEQGERQWMANEVEEDESPAVPAYIANHAHQIAFAQVMAEVHTECHVGERERVAHRIRLKNRNRCGNGAVRIEVHADCFDSQPAPDVVHHRACTATHIQYAADRQRIPANGADHESRVAQAAVDSGQIAIGALY